MLLFCRKMSYILFKTSLNSVFLFMLEFVIRAGRNLLRPAGIQLQPATFSLKVYYAEDLPRSKSCCCCTIINLLLMTLLQRLQAFFGLLWTPAQRSLSEVHYILPMFLFIYFFYGRLILRPRLTEVRETFTRGGP